MDKTAIVAECVKAKNKRHSCIKNAEWFEDWLDDYDTVTGDHRQYPYAHWACSICGRDLPIYK